MIVRTAMVAVVPEVVCRQAIEKARDWLYWSPIDTLEASK